MATSTLPQPDLLVFDVNETLLDLAPVRERIVALLGGDSTGVGLWFRTLLHYSLVHNATNQYAPFGEIAVAALQLTAARLGCEVSTDAARTALAALRTLPPHPKVPAALERLQSAGFRLAALTNGSQAGMTAQLAYAELSPYFSAQLSVEQVGCFKPDRRVYKWAGQELKAEAATTVLVAAHPWDLMGARAAGWQTAFLQRPAIAWYPLAVPPDYATPDLAVLAEQLLE
jgi:2-haloacid dehalogenase